MNPLSYILGGLLLLQILLYELKLWRERKEVKRLTDLLAARNMNELQVIKKHGHKASATERKVRRPSPANLEL